MVEAAGDGKCDDSVNITNLMAEIESFVKTSATISDEDEKADQTKSNEKVVPTTKEITLRQSPESNDFYTGDESASNLQDKLTLDKIQNLGAACDYDLLDNYERDKRSPVKILIREPTEEDNEVEAATNTKLSDEVNETKVNDVTEIALPDTLVNGNQEHKKENKPVADHFGNNECNTPTSLEVENILENQNRYSVNSTTTSLRITESCDDLLNQLNDESTSTFEVVNIPFEISPLKSAKNENMSEVNKEMPITNSRFKVRTVPLKNFSPAPSRKNLSSEIMTNGAAVQEAPPTPPRRTRTVKEIIESINKSQSLLKINQDNNKAMDKLTTSFSTQEDGNAVAVDPNLNDSMAKNYYERKKLFAEVADENGNENIFNGYNVDGGYNNNDIPLCVARYNEVSKNNSILFEKCVVGRNRNDHGANDVDAKSTSVEWNPVPKPRRHKHVP